MSDLRLAGLISGFGEGIKSGADHLTNAFIQSGLMGEREKYEQARQQLVFNHDDTAVANKQTYDKGILQQTQDFTAGQNQARMGADIVNSTADRVSRADENQKTIDANKAIHDETNKSTLENTREGHRLTNEGAAQTQKALDARNREDLANKIEVAKIQAGKAAAKETLDPGIKAQIDAQMKILDVYGASLNSDMATPGAETKLKKAVDEISRLSGADVSNPEGGPLVGDRWAGKLKPKPFKMMGVQ